MRRNLLLTALIDEVDEAIGSLQPARRLLGELRRADDQSGRGGSQPVATYQNTEPPPTSPLRYSGMNVAEAARTLRMSEEHVRRLLRRGELEGVGYGGRVGWRLARDYVLGLAEQQRIAREGRVQACRDRDTSARAGQRTTRRR